MPMPLGRKAINLRELLQILREAGESERKWAASSTAWRRAWGPAVGGIALQLRDYSTGFLVNSPESAPSASAICSTGRRWANAWVNWPGNSYGNTFSSPVHCGMI
jgi:hypothetical protein